MKILFIAISALLLATADGPDKLKGRWQSPVSPKGTVTSIFFPGDSSFEGFVNRKPFVTGTYTLQDSLFSFVDNGCEGIRGVYKLVFFSNEDSLRFIPVMDSCAQRKQGMIRLVMGRIKQETIN
jgi:hypothetical protein